MYIIPIYPRLYTIQGEQLPRVRLSKCPYVASVHAQLIKQQYVYTMLSDL